MAKKGQSGGFWKRFAVLGGIGLIIALTGFIPEKNELRWSCRWVFNPLRKLAGAPEDRSFACMSRDARKQFAIERMKEQGRWPGNGSRKESEKLAPGVHKIVLTAYTSRKAETDNSPCIAADNTNICQRYERGERLCASNHFPFGYEIEVPGYGRCKIVDKMNTDRCGKNSPTICVDIYLGDAQGCPKKKWKTHPSSACERIRQAKAWGRKTGKFVVNG